MLHKEYRYFATVLHVSIGFCCGSLPSQQISGTAAAAGSHHNAGKPKWWPDEGSTSPQWQGVSVTAAAVILHEPVASKHCCWARTLTIATYSPAPTSKQSTVEKRGCGLRHCVLMCCWHVQDHWPWHGSSNTYIYALDFNVPKRADSMSA